MEAFDKMMAKLDGLNDTVATQESTIRTMPLWGIEGGSETWIVNTVRQKEVGDFIFLEYVAEGRATRLVLPPKVAATIARQRDSLGTMNRRKTGKAVMAERMAAGEQPGFLKGKRK